MNIEKNRKRLQTDLLANLAIGAVLLAAGILARATGLWGLENPKALVGLSFIPIALAFMKWFQLHRLKRHAVEMKPTLIAENDERLIAERNKAEAAAGRILRYLLYLLFLGYTLSTPSVIFETVEWWTLFGLFFLSQALPAFFLTIASVRSQRAGEE